MIDLTLIGIGTGNPDHLTLQGIAAIQAADLVLVPSKGEDKSELAALRHAMLDRHLIPGRTAVAGIDMPRRDGDGPDYLAGVEAWHDAIAAEWHDRITDHLPGAHGHVAVLVWGDPSLYDSSLRIAARLARQMPLRTKVIPGITAVQALCAAHALLLNDIGGPVLLTTGRQLRDHGWPAGSDRLVVMLDGGCAFQTLPPEGVRIWWGAFLGMPNQLVDCGPLHEAGPRIIAARAAARAAHGWIMDIYLLARKPLHGRRMTAV